MTTPLAVAGDTTHINPIAPTLTQWAGTLVVFLVILLIVFWPVIYALTKRRWFRAFAYLCLTQPVIWVTLNRNRWWGPVDPDNEYSPLRSGLLYGVSVWPALVAILWTITAVSDHLLAPDTSQAPPAKRVS